MSETYRREMLDAEFYIPGSRDSLVNALLKQFAVEAERRQFAEACRLIGTLCHLDHRALEDDLRRDYRLFSDICERCLLSDEQLRAAEGHFLSGFCRLLEANNFRPLTKREWDISDSETFLDLPIQVDWSRFDDQMLRNFYTSHGPPENACTDHPSCDRVMIFRRGVGVEQVVGWFLIKKLERTVANVATTLWRGCFKLIGLFRRKVAVAPDAAVGGPCAGRSDGGHSTERGEALTADETFAGGACGAVASSTTRRRHPQRYVQPVKLMTHGPLLSFVKKTVVQEPTFAELVVVFRRACSRDAPDDWMINIKAFRDIPMPDFQVVFPHHRVRMKHLDVIKLLFVAGTAAVAIISKLLSSAISPHLAAAVLTIVGVYAIRIYTDFRASKSRYRELATDIVAERTTGVDVGVVTALVDDLEERRFKGLVLTFYLLTKQSNTSRDQLESRGEDFLHDEFGIEATFDGIGFVRELRRYGLATTNDECLAAQPLDEAVASLAAQVQRSALHSSLGGVA